MLNKNQQCNQNDNPSSFFYFIKWDSKYKEYEAHKLLYWKSTKSQRGI